MNYICFLIHDGTGHMRWVCLMKENHGRPITLRYKGKWISIFHQEMHYILFTLALHLCIIFDLPLHYILTCMLSYVYFTPDA